MQAVQCVDCLSGCERCVVGVGKIGKFHMKTSLSLDGIHATYMVLYRPDAVSGVSFPLDTFPTLACSKGRSQEHFLANVYRRAARLPLWVLSFTYLAMMTNGVLNLMIEVVISRRLLTVLIPRVTRG